ncbi:MAG: hypothetical protein M0Z31_07920 [Clostridia bacterium]|nr:hypothetical protein [Clostridia bacterium]
MKINAFFQTQEELNKALYNLEREFPDFSNQAFQANQVSRGRHLTEMWETMGASTGTLLGRMIGLGIETGILMTNALMVAPLEAAQRTEGQEKPQGVRVEVE